MEKGNEQGILNVEKGGEEFTCGRGSLVHGVPGAEVVGAAVRHWRETWRQGNLIFTSLLSQKGQLADFIQLLSTQHWTHNPKALKYFSKVLVGQFLF